MGLEDKIKKLEKAVQGSNESFELADGARYSYDPEKIYSETFLHGMSALRADHAREPRPPAPEIVVAISKAKNRGRAYRQVMGVGSSLLAYEEKPLIEEGELKPKKLTAMGPVESVGEED